MEFIQNGATTVDMGTSNSIIMRCTFPFFSLAKSPPRDLQNEEYSAHE